MNRRLYRRTKAGTAAWQRQDQSVPLEYRRVLGVIDGDMHVDNLRGRLPFTEVGLSALLEDLVEDGFLEAVEHAETHDLDFTGNLNLSDLRKAAAKQ
jgi:hypothetical protein